MSLPAFPWNLYRKGVFIIPIPHSPIFPRVIVKDKMAVMSVFSSLMHEPTLVLDERYPLTVQDFPERFHRIIFSAIDNLVRSGMRQLDESVVDDFISKYPTQYAVFEQNNGLDYLHQVMSGFYAPQNFEHNYLTVRKCALLNLLASQGYDISPFYDSTTVDPAQADKAQKLLDGSSLEDIINYYENGLALIKNEYRCDAVSKSVQAGTGLKELKNRLKEVPEIGLPLNSPKLTTIFRGRRLKKFYLKVVVTGGGKSRMSAADAALLSIPERWDVERGEWVQTGFCESTLFISTELEIDEVQTLIMAYVSAVPEDHILDGRYASPEEEARVDHAISLIETSPLYIEYMPDFNIDDIENVVKKHKRQHSISYVFFDYLATSIKLLMEIASKTRGVNLREDNVLVMFSTRLSFLAKKLNVHIDTSAQANGEWKTMKDPDQNVTRGAKGISDKVDIGYCGLPPTEKDLEAFKRIVTASGMGFVKMPNLVLHIYKVRRGKVNHVKIFQFFDYATLRTTDLLVTTKDYLPLDVENTNIELILDGTEVQSSDDTAKSGSITNEETSQDFIV